jgi:hypothetical protein
MVADYGIGRNSLIDLVIPSTIQITVKTPSGKNIPMDIKNGERIGSVRQRIEKEQGIRSSQRGLSSKGVGSDDKRTVADYQVRKGGILDLYTPLSMMQIFAKNICESELSPFIWDVTIIIK